MEAQGIRFHVRGKCQVSDGKLCRGFVDVADCFMARCMRARQRGAGHAKQQRVPRVAARGKATRGWAVGRGAGGAAEGGGEGAGGGGGGAERTDTTAIIERKENGWQLV